MDPIGVEGTPIPGRTPIHAAKRLVPGGVACYTDMQDRKEECCVNWNALYENCRLCPRECGVDRLRGERGLCGVDHTLRIARAALHYWEEPCISGEQGSGTVFFSGCGLQCVFCQNRAISAEQFGRDIPDGRLAAIFLELQEKGAQNINLVTPTHYIPTIAPALQQARTMGLRIPVVYNTSGYEKPETLRLLEGLVDVWLDDFKYIDPVLAEKYSGAADYFTYASAALEEMVRQAGDPCFDAEGRMLRGVIVRHLLLPGCEGDSRAVLQYLYETYGEKIYLSIMNQYTPLPHVVRFPELDRKITDAEYDSILDYAIGLGIENAFIQEGGTAEESFIPPFDCEGV